jgi:hypothetical protein
MTFTRRAAFGTAITALMLTTITTAYAGESMLFKVITDHDDIIIGLTADDIGATGNAGTVGAKLAENGNLAAWQYIVTRDSSGNLVLAATQKISILANASLRIEPYTAALPVVEHK